MTEQKPRTPCLASLTDVPRLEVRLTKLLAPASAGLMKRGLKVNPEGIARSRERMAEVFTDVERRLADGRRYLCGDRFTAADLTFASLAVPAVMPPELAAYVPMDRMPPAMADDVARQQATVAGRFALRLYREDRGMPGALRADAR